MATHHIAAEKGDFAKVVLLPGDPLRARWIAENYLDDFRLINDVRGELAYTGYSKDKHKRISVMSSGMGMPSIGIYARELFTYYGVESLIRIGTMGTYLSDVQLKDLVIAQGASTDSNWMSQWDLRGATYSALSSFSLLEEAVKIARERKLPFQVGNILSADIFYDHDPRTADKWRDLGVLGVEMESYALFQIASELRKKALALLTVTDSFSHDTHLNSAERQEGLSQMVSLAIALAERFA